LSQLQIPSEVQKKVDRELDPEEEIKWIDQPIPQFFTMYSLPTFLFAIPWTSFSIFWIWGAFEATSSNSKQGAQAPDFFYLFPLFGLPFLAMGIAMLSTPFWEWRRKRNTVYLITNQRAIAIEGGTPLQGILPIKGNQSQTIKSFSPEQLNNIYRREKTNGSGDVILGVRERTNSKGYSYNQEIGFFGVRDAKEVEDMLKELAENAS
jgi:hypothetical protein